MKYFRAIKQYSNKETSSQTYSTDFGNIFEIVSELLLFFSYLLYIVTMTLCFEMLAFHPEIIRCANNERKCSNSSEY